MPTFRKETMITSTLSLAGVFEVRTCEFSAELHMPEEIFVKVQQASSARVSCFMTV